VLQENSDWWNRVQVEHFCQVSVRFRGNFSPKQCICILSIVATDSSVHPEKGSRYNFIQSSHRLSHLSNETLDYKYHPHFYKQLILDTFCIVLCVHLLMNHTRRISSFLDDFFEGVPDEEVTSVEIGSSMSSSD
jgi:hypothetical protein